MKADGTIYYNGKQIQRYLVDGLNLMEKQYDILNENLPVGAVRKVQIIEHDQPIRLLDSLKFSDKPALNLKLKKYLTTGVGKLAVGINPFLWDVDLTPIVFKKEFQMLNSFQSNNIGIDLKDRIPNDNIKKYGAGMIGIEDILTPDFDMSRWLNNHGNFISSNILKKIGSNIELRGNVSFLNNFEIQSGNIKTVFNLPDQKVDLLETINNHYNKNTFQAALKLERNDKKLYWKDKFSLKKQWNNNLGSLQNDRTKGSSQYHNIQQRYSTNYTNLSNEFHAIIPLKNHIIQLKSSINYYNLPQTLTVRPGQFDSLLNGGIPYHEVKQQLNIHVLHIRNTAGWNTSIGAMRLSPTIGIDADLQQQTSELLNPLIEPETPNQALNNNAIYSKWTSFGSINGQIKKKKWRLNFQLPISYQTITIKNKLTSNRSVLSKMSFDPSAYTVFNFDKLSSITYTTKLIHQYNNLSRLYTGYILKNYRSIQRMTSDIPLTVSFLNSLNWNYKDPLHQLFIYIGYSITTNKNNITYGSNVTENGVTQILAHLTENHTTRQTISLHADKYILPLKSTVKARASYTYEDGNMLLNKVFTGVINKNLNFGFQLDILAAKQLNINCKSNFTRLTSQIAENRATNVNLLEQHLAFNIFPAKNHMISIKGDYFSNNYTSDKNQFFLDAKYRFSFGEKKKYDLSMILNNILNASQYHFVRNSGFLTV